MQGEPGDVPGEHFMGYTVRVADWRYTEWVLFDNQTGTANWGIPPYGVELYAERLGARDCDFDTDSRNVASDPANAATMTTLSTLLRQRVTPARSDGGVGSGWEGARRR